MTPSDSILHPADVAKVVRGYQQRIAQHGPTLPSLNSGGEEKQRLRYCVHASALRGVRPSVLDVGCGLGGFYRYLGSEGIQVSYAGYDVVPEYVEECRRQIPEGLFLLRNIFVDGFDADYDTIVMSQVLNNRYAESDNFEVMKSALRMAYEHARVSVSVDMMSSYVDFQNPELFYYSPEEIFGFAKSLARRVVLRHDYRPFEFCVQLFHPQALGYVP